VKSAVHFLIIKFSVRIAYMYIFLVTILIIICLVVLVTGFIQVNNLIALFLAKGVPFVPLNKQQLERIKKNLKISNIKDKKIVDLGSGDGRVLRLFEQMGAEDIVGYEINWWAHIKAKILNSYFKSKVKVFYKNFNNVDLSQFDVVFCYLLPRNLKKMVKRFEKEIRSDAIIISYAFEIDGWQGEIEMIETNQLKPKLDRIFIYKK